MREEFHDPGVIVIVFDRYDLIRGAHRQINLQIIGGRDGKDLFDSILFIHDDDFPGANRLQVGLKKNVGASVYREGAFHVGAQIELPALGQKEGARGLELPNHRRHSIPGVAADRIEMRKEVVVSACQPPKHGFSLTVSRRSAFRMRRKIRSDRRKANVADRQAVFVQQRDGESRRHLFRRLGIRTGGQHRPAGNECQKHYSEQLHPRVPRAIKVPHNYPHPPLSCSDQRLQYPSGSMRTETVNTPTLCVNCVVF